MTAPCLNVSVVICTYADARWSLLQTAIQSVRHQCPAPREVLVVVDHNPALYERVRSTYADLIVLENQRQPGLSGARNMGLERAQGAYIAFLDDDAWAEPDWLARLIAWCEQDHVIGAGGSVLPAWQCQRPGWFPEEFDWVIGCTYRGLPESAQAVRNVFGGCMCVRREIFRSAGGFHDGMGRINEVPLGCEETELCIRASQYWPTVKFMFDPAAAIHHHVPASRLTWRYFLGRCYSEGASKALLSRLVGSRAGLAAERAYTTRVLPAAILRDLRAALLGRRLAPLGRVAAVGLGFLTTVVGFAVTWVWPRRLPTGESLKLDPALDDEYAPQADLGVGQ
jgi:GT2 family glycosyltransferase